MIEAYPPRLTAAGVKLRSYETRCCICEVKFSAGSHHSVLDLELECNSCFEIVKNIKRGGK